MRAVHVCSQLAHGSPPRYAIGPHDGLGNHDSTTLGGNSGSAVIDVRTGKVAALHFAGVEGEANFCIQAPVLGQILQQHL